MPLADLKKQQTLVRFKWSHHRDTVTIHGFFGYATHPNDPVKVQKMTKTRAQQYWKKLVGRGFKHIGTYENGQQVK